MPLKGGSDIWTISLGSAITALFRILILYILGADSRRMSVFDALGSGVGVFIAGTLLSFYNAEIKLFLIVCVLSGFVGSVALRVILMYVEKKFGIEGLTELAPDIDLNIEDEEAQEEKKDE